LGENVGIFPVSVSLHLKKFNPAWTTPFDNSEEKYVQGEEAERKKYNSQRKSHKRKHFRVESWLSQ
jgi:hypothetical protein